jgi:hypothetical protein
MRQCGRKQRKDISRAKGNFKNAKKSKKPTLAM